MEPVTGMAAILSAISDVFTAAVGWISSVLSTITASGNEILLFFVIMGVVGFGVGLVKRLLQL